MALLILLACLAATCFPLAFPFPPAIGFFREGPLYSETYSARTQPSPFDESQPLEKRARSYLAIHCSACHRSGGVLQGSLDLRFNTPLSLTGLLALSDRRDADGKSLNRARICAGKPEDSDVYHRLRSTGKDAMPPLGRTSPDERGLALIRTWIISLQSMAPSRSDVGHWPSEQNKNTPQKIYRVIFTKADRARHPGTSTLPRGRYEWPILRAHQQEIQMILLVL